MPSHIGFSVQKNLQKWGGFDAIPGRVRRRGARIRMRLENFRVGPSNRLAYLAMQALAGGDPVPWRCLHLHGPSGAGKTHLVSALLHAWKSREPGSIVGMTGEEFVRGYRWAFRRGRMAQFHQALERASCLAVEDVERLASAPSAQRELARVCDAIGQRGGTLVFTGREQPYRLALQERLQDRLASGLVLSLANGVPSAIAASAR